MPTTIASLMVPVPTKPQIIEVSLCSGQWCEDHVCRVVFFEEFDEIRLELPRMGVRKFVGTIDIFCPDGLEHIVVLIGQGITVVRALKILEMAV